jgi:hypothetical protein
MPFILNGQRRPRTLSFSSGLFATLLGTALLVVVTGIVFALGRDMTTGTIVAGEATVAAGGRC